MENARENARRNGIENADFICADASEAAEKFLRDGVRPEVVVVDPPRKGMDEAAVRALCGMEPDRVVYVSCNPATLARDITVFNSCGYELKCAEAVDMFPRTSHVETGMLALPLTVGIIGLRYSTDLVLAVATVAAIQEKYHVMKKLIGGAT